MRFTIIWQAEAPEKKNQKTLDFLRRELENAAGEVQVLLYGASAKWTTKAQELPGLAAAEGFSGASFSEILADAVNRAEGFWTTWLSGGDTWTEGTLKEVAACSAKFPQQRIQMLRKIQPDGEEGAFSDRDLVNTCVRSVERNMGCHPFYFGGTFVQTSLLRETGIPEAPVWEQERKTMLELCLKSRNLLFIPEKKYLGALEREGEESFTFYHEIYEKHFYLESFSDFWIPWLAQLQEEYGSVPALVQVHAVFTITRRFQANWNNRNKHVLNEEETARCFELIGGTLQYIDDNMLYDAKKLRECALPDSARWVLGILKYGKDYRFDTGYVAGKMYYRGGDVLLNTISSLKTTIQFMDAHNGRLEIDGNIHPLLYSMADSIYFEYATVRYQLDYNERYALTKVLGTSIYKNHSFHVRIPFKKNPGSVLYCFAMVGGERVTIQYGYESHFSRMSDRFQNSYWAFSDDTGEYIMTQYGDGLKIDVCDKDRRRRQERSLWKEMFFAEHDRKRARLFIAIRAAFFALRPVMKRRPIWMYLDKIYKAGDSAEYLYKYASRQDNNFQHYYLVDRNAPDFKRLKAEGFKPLVRGSVKHRLVFLMADMMVISNSTVFTFNNFGMINSSYVRDLTDFHVCCVQHGMSVQQIALAQNRLRDNTRLYFCASKYELRNLYKPVYDYYGYDALKLTGVPRYDGLVNEDKKQILISPTWRMQAAVPVRGSEGMARQYNPLFKESMYFKIYNALINDPRLIEAAKKYGYKIKYVLHPIVSSQVKDFKKNDYVEIIPAAGDMSYEKLFRESSLMVTDYSGIQFDFAYMRKPLLYLHHRDIPQHYEEGTFFYDTMAFGEICHDNDELIAMLEEYMAEGCRMKPEYVRRADDFFYYSDHNNCKRIYDVMVDYQERHILKTKPVLPEEPEKLQGEFNVAEREDMLEEVDTLLEKKGVEPEPTTITDDYFDEDIRRRSIVLLGLGKNVRGNMQYILNELNSSSYFEGFKIYVRADGDTEPLIRGFIEKNGWTRTEPVTDDRTYARLLESAGTLITEVFFPRGWVKRPEQTVINIWHGTPLKKLGLAKNTRNLHKDGNTQRNFIESTWLVYPNRYTKSHMLSSYKVKWLLTGRTALLGYPRTGGMLAAEAGDLSALKKRLAPEGQKIFAYMPTWKDYLSDEEIIAEGKAFLDAMDPLLTKKQILYCNLHHKVSDNIDYSAYRHIRRFPPDVDTYELLAAANALVTDYSSVFYDFMATAKQVVLYCPDYQEYRRNRGVYMEIDELPFDKAVTVEEVAEALKRGKTYKDYPARQKFCRYDTPDNAKKLCGLIYSEHMADGVPVENAPVFEGRRILVYSEDFRDIPAIDVLRHAADHTDKERTRLYLSGEMEEIDNYRDTAYPMLRHHAVIGVVGDMHLSGRGKALRKLWEEGKVPFEQAIRYLRYDYALASCRMYGRAAFDRVLIYDVRDPDQMLALSSIRGERWLYVHRDHLEKIRRGDHVTKDVLTYTASRCSRVFVMEESLLEETGKLLPECSPEVFAGLDFNE